MKNGLFIDHTFSLKTRLLVYLQGGELKVNLNHNLERDPLPTLSPFPFDDYADGLWHSFFIHLETNKIIVQVDNKISYTTKVLLVQSGLHYTFGGGVFGKSGFIGCIRRLMVQNTLIHLKSIKSLKLIELTPNEIVIGTCRMVDRCHPNPCEHGAVCRQDDYDFHCDCDSTGYTGAVCHSPKYPSSCDAFKLRPMHADFFHTSIDVDGSGPLKPFTVGCKMSPDYPIVTIVHHNSETTVNVKGYEAPGSYHQDLVYFTDIEQILLLMNRSYSCSQFLKYECYNAQLFNTPSETSFNPFTWWMSRSNQKMSYWGGSLPHSRKCSCGISGTCKDPNAWCNCDSKGYASKWLVDEGSVSEKEYLPIRSIFVGDTGLTSSDEKKARFTIGPLHCEGNNMLDNVVTFRQLDSLIPLPLKEFGSSADIHLQFKTTAESGVLIHLAGPDDYVKLSLIGQKNIQLSFDVGYGQQKVEVETSNKLNDDKWHVVTFEWNRKEVTLFVDSTSWGSVVNKLDTSRFFDLSSKWVLGATIDEKEGYVGCMRAVSFNGMFFDLKQIVIQGVAGKPLYGVTLGCIGKCTSNPCLNNGTCHDYYSSYVCDCQWTGFKGRICADEIGVTLRSDNYIKYDFEERISTIEERIRVGFTTTEHKGLIIGISSESNEYLNLVMSTSGNLRLIFDFGFERQELIIKNENFALGQHHDVTIARFDKGTKMSITVNNYEPIIYTFKIADKADAHFNLLKSIYIGRNESMSTGEGFVGCISRVSFDDHFPLRSLFQEDRRANVEAFPSLDSVHEDTCGIESVTHPPELIETRPSSLPEHFQENLSILDNLIISSIVFGSVLLFFIIFFIALFLSGRFAAKQKGDYKTHEDKGAKDALDPDAAVMKGMICPDISKKREYFI